MTEQLVPEDDIPDDTPEKIRAIAKTDIMDDYSDAFADLLQFFSENFTENDDGDLAVAIPSYNGSNASSFESVSSEIAETVEEDRDYAESHVAVAIVDGELVRCTID